MTWRRGEYRVPAGPARGPLVAVEVEIDGDRFGDARLVGDLAAEPPDVAARLRAAIVGGGTGAGPLADRIAAALGAEELATCAPGDVVIAVRRAVSGATDWQEHTFELIAGDARTPWEHLALDQVLTDAVGRGARGPTLRMWEWDRPAAVLGSFQSLRNEIDADGAARHGVCVVRRGSGGGTMFIEPEKTITFSLSVPKSLVAGMSFAASYRFLDDWVLGALAEIGVAAEYVPLNDIASPQGKIAGAAQKRLASGAVLHHVTMAYDIDTSVMLEVLRTFRPAVSARGTRSAQKRVDPLRRQVDLPRSAVVAAMVDHFRARYRCADGAVTDAERRAAAVLARERFVTSAWTARIP